MKINKISILVIIFIFSLSCKKSKQKKAFIKGRLVENCDMNIVSNQELLLYDGGGTLLETTVTNNEGNFWFYGKGYTDKKTVSINSGSIKTPEGTKLAYGYLGKGKGSTSSEISNQELGDLFLNGVTFELSVNIDNSYEGQIYDSVTCTSSYQGGILYTVLKNSNNGFFTEDLGYQTSYLKQFGLNNNDPNSTHHKFKFSTYFNYYKDGETNLSVGKNLSYDACSDNNVITIINPQ